MTPAVAVTGATGQLGGGVAAALAAHDVPLRLLVRDAARAPRLPGAEVAVATYADGAAVAAALTGIETVFMVSGAEELDRLAAHRSFVDAAVAAGVRRIVYTSFFAAAADATFTLARDHWHTEQHIRAAGGPFTFLRDNLYADVLVPFAGPDGVLLGPAGDGRVSAVARRDVVDAAVTVLLAAAGAPGGPGGTAPSGSPHDGRTYDLTGPESLSLADAARIISEATGRTVRYEPQTVAQAFASRAGYGAPEWQVEAWVSTYTAIASGELAPVSGDVELLTGRPATTLARLLAAG